VGEVTKSKPQINTVKMGLTTSGQSIINPIFNLINLDEGILIPTDYRTPTSLKSRKEIK
jgi:hypothetical protein